MWYKIKNYHPQMNPCHPWPRPLISPQNSKSQYSYLSPNNPIWTRTLICSSMGKSRCLTSWPTTTTSIMMKIRSTTTISNNWGEKEEPRGRMRIYTQTMERKRQAICTCAAREYRRSMRRFRILSGWWWEETTMIKNAMGKTSMGMTNHLIQTTFLRPNMLS